MAIISKNEASIDKSLPTCPILTMEHNIYSNGLKRKEYAIIARQLYSKRPSLIQAQRAMHMHSYVPAMAW